MADFYTRQDVARQLSNPVLVLYTKDSRGDYPSSDPILLLFSSSRRSLLNGGQLLLYGRPMHAAVPLCTPSMTTKDNISVPPRQKSLHQQNVINIRESEVISSYIVLVS